MGKVEFQRIMLYKKQEDKLAEKKGGKPRELWDKSWEVWYRRVVGRNSTVSNSAKIKEYIANWFNSL